MPSPTTSLEPSVKNVVLHSESPSPLPDWLSSACMQKDIPSLVAEQGHDHPSSDGLSFRNAEHAQQMIPYAPWNPPENDSTFPSTVQDEQRYVLQLVAAFKDLTSASGSLNAADRRRFKIGEPSCYSNSSIEACAWDVLNKTKQVHTHGFRFPILDTGILHNIFQTRGWCFQERIENICVTLRISKNAAVSLMKQEKVWTIIGSPEKISRSSTLNAQSNAKRAPWIKHGRELDADHQTRAEAKRQKCEENKMKKKVEKPKGRPRRSAVSLPGSVKFKLPFNVPASSDQQSPDVDPSPAPAPMASQQPSLDNISDTTSSEQGTLATPIANKDTVPITGKVDEVPKNTNDSGPEEKKEYPGVETSDPTIVMGRPRHSEKELEAAKIMLGLYLDKRD
ncbi:hypothetical protein ACN47E_000928 [Coniothyrium glycines]